MNLPGSVLKLTPSSMCDNHADELAVICIQGETDSFGYEKIHMCQECYDLYTKHLEDVKNSDNEDACDWCKRVFKVVELRAFRDWTEGYSGSVYTVCPECIQQSLNDIENDLGY